MEKPVMKIETIKEKRLKESIQNMSRRVEATDVNSMATQRAIIIIKMSNIFNRNEVAKIGFDYFSIVKWPFDEDSGLTLHVELFAWQLEDKCSRYNEFCLDPKENDNGTAHNKLCESKYLIY